MTQAREIGGAELASRFPVLVAPALYVASDDDLDLLVDYAAAGGHLVVGIRTGYGDEEARARVAVAPDRLRDAAGVHYEEFSNLLEDVPVDAERRRSRHPPRRPAPSGRTGSSPTAPRCSPATGIRASATSPR